MPLRQCDTKTVRRGPQVLSKRRLPNTIDRRRGSLPPPGRVVGHGARPRRAAILACINSAQAVPVRVPMCKFGLSLRHVR